MTTRIQIPHDDMTRFCAESRIRQLSLFGSVLRDDFRPDSDIDMLFEFDPGAVVGLLDKARMERELSGLLAHSVDLKTPADLSRYFRQQVMDLAEV